MKDNTITADAYQRLLAELTSSQLTEALLAAL